MVAVLGLFAAGSCTHPLTAFHRWALLPAGILETDTSREWLSEAIPLILQNDLSPAKDATSAIVPTHSAAYGFQASDEIEATVETGNAGQRIQIFVRSLVTQKTSDVISSRVTSNLIGAVDVIAKQLDTNAVPFSTHDEMALHAYVDGLRSADVETRIRNFEAAAQADPHFGMAQMLLITTQAQTANPGLGKTIRAASSVRAEFTPLDRAKFDSLVSRVTHADLAREQAAADVVVKLTPNEPDALAVLGSLQFLGGDGRGGERSLARAYSLSGSNPAIRRQFAEGLLEAKQFRRAEELFSQGTTGQDLIGRAVCSLLAKDTTRSNDFIHSLEVELGTDNPAVPILRAEWDILTGNSPERMLPERVGSSQPDGAIASAYQAFLLGDFATAAPQWQTILSASGRADLRSRAMLAGCLERLGRSSEIAPLQVEPFVPDLTGTDPFAAIPFVEMRRVLHL